MKPQELQSLLRKTIPAGLPVVIKGAPGVGKSEIVDQVCRMLDADLIIEHPVVSDPTDYKGLPFANKNGEAEFLPFGNLRKLINVERRTVCFLDDLGQASVSVQAACMQLLLARRINGHKVSDQVTFLAATNRHTDRSGVTGLLEAVKSRFATIVELAPDVEDWVAWALDHNIPTELIQFIRFRPNMLHDFKPTNELKNSPCPRTIVNASRLMQAGIPAGIEYETYTGSAGEGFAAEFCGFLKIFRSLPNPDAVLLAPEKADVPTDPATLYAICGSLARRASENTMERIVTYARRLPAEFSVLMVQDSYKLCPEVQNTRAFITWASENQDVLI